MGLIDEAPPNYWLAQVKAMKDQLPANVYDLACRLCEEKEVTYVLFPYGDKSIACRLMISLGNTNGVMDVTIDDGSMSYNIEIEEKGNEFRYDILEFLSQWD